MSQSSPSPQVSVVCAWYNRADYLRLTIDSLLVQTHPAYEIVLVDDGSPDPRVREILGSYDDPRLKILHQENTGFVGAIRRAVDASSGEYLAIQGAGDISFPNRLLQQARFLETNPEFAAVGCTINNQLVSAGSSGPIVPSDAPGYDGSGSDSGEVKLELTPAMVMERNPYSHGEVMLRRSAYDAAGGYRDFFRNAQDKDLWLRLLEAHRLAVMKGWHYQRHSFTSDGIAANLKNLLVQTAYSMIGEQCYFQRQAGEKDSVDRYGALALMSVPKGQKTIQRVLRSVKQAWYYRSLEENRAEQLRTVRDLYGPVAHAMAWAMLRYLDRTPGAATRPR